MPVRYRVRLSVLLSSVVVSADHVSVHDTPDVMARYTSRQLGDPVAAVLDRR